MSKVHSWDSWACYDYKQKELSFSVDPLKEELFTVQLRIFPRIEWETAFDPLTCVSHSLRAVCGGITSLTPPGYLESIWLSFLYQIKFLRGVAERLVLAVTSCQRTWTTAEVTSEGFGGRHPDCQLQDLMRGKTDLLAICLISPALKDTHSLRSL